MNRLLLMCAFFVLLQVAAQATAQTSVWEVSKGSNRLFLGGTVHLLSKKDFPLPCQYQSAFSQADKLYFETDIKALESPDLQVQMLKRAMYPAGESILDKLTPETADLLSQYFADASIPGAAFIKFKPGMLMSALTVMELGKLGITAAGVDQYFIDEAIKSNKEVGYLEQPQEQLEFLFQLGVGNEDKFIRYLIESMAELEDEFTELMDAWRTGDMPKMADVSDLERMKQDFPSLFQVLIKQRNFAWLNKIKAMMGDSVTEYVLVGGLHMAGEIGLLNQLEKSGYKVTQMLSCSQ